MTTSELTTIQTATRELATMLTIEGDRLDDGIARHIHAQVRSLEQMIAPDPTCHLCGGSGYAPVSLYGDEIPGVSVTTTDVCSCVGQPALADIPY